MLPIAAFALASAGAVSTNATKVAKAAAPPMIGYIHTALEACKSVNVNCDLNGNAVCESAGQTVFRKDSGLETCNTQLRRTVINP